MKRLIKDNRGQVLYAVIITVMFVSLLAMIAMGLTLKNYHAAVQKQQHVADYYAADAVAELIRIGKYDSSDETWQNVKVTEPSGEATYYEITCNTVTIRTIIDKDNDKFISWEVNYHAVQEQETTPAE